jgi:hypothetical protein
LQVYDILANMAMLITKTNKAQFIPAKTAIIIWQIMNGERQPANDRQQRFCESVKRVYIPQELAPKSYVDHYRHLFRDDRPVIVGKKKFVARLPYKD